MNPMQSSPIRPTDGTPTDIFGGARWLDSPWNSSAKAVSPDEIEWQCNTWGSGRGHGYWVDAAIFRVVAEAFNLRTSRNHECRDELVVAVPLRMFPRIASVIDRLDQDEPEAWPWFDEDAEDAVAIAVEVLDMSPTALAEHVPLIEELRIVSRKCA